MINIEVSGVDRSRHPLKVELIESGPINEDGVPEWHDYKGPQTGDRFRAEWNSVERKYIALPMD